MPYKGSIVAILHQLAGGLRAAMGYTGSAQHRRDAHAAEVRAHHERRRARKPRARRDDHQGSAELPCQLSARSGRVATARHPRAPHPDPRFRRAVHAADRAPRARERRLLRDPSLGHERRRRARLRRHAASSCRADRSRSPTPSRRARRRPCSSSACRCSASATACRRWRSSSAVASRRSGSPRVRLCAGHA